MQSLINNKRVLRAISLLVSTSLLCSQACSLPSDSTIDSLSPDAFQGLAIYSDRVDGLLASFNITSTKSIHVFGKLSEDLTPSDLYKLVLTDDLQPSKDIGMEFGAQGRLAKIAVAGTLLSSYSYSSDGTTVTETLANGSTHSFTIDTSLSPQEILDQMGEDTGTDLSHFFDTFAADADPTLAKSIRPAFKAQNVEWRLLGAAVNLVGLGLSTAALMALAPEAGVAVILLTVAGHTAALLNTGISMAQLFDSTGKLSSDPTVSNLATGVSLTGYVLTPTTAGIDAAQRGIIVLEDSSIWAAMATSKVDIFVTVLSSGPGPDGSGVNLPDDSSSGGGTSGNSINVLAYRNPDGTTGSDGSNASIWLGGDPSLPTISWKNLHARLLTLDNPITTRIDYGVQLASGTPEGTYLSSPISYGDYTINGTTRYWDASPSVWSLLPNIIYTITVSGQEGYATLSFQLR